MRFVDWIPGICSSLGMLVINSIEKSRLQADSWNYSGNGVAWKAQFVLFLGFALLAGGLAGGVTVLVLKYLIQGYPMPTLYFGIANVVANGLVMVRYVFFFAPPWLTTWTWANVDSSIVLWVSQNIEDDYTYNLTL